MKISCPQPDLLARLQVVGRAASTRSAVPALGGILVEVSEAGLRLAATDLEVGLEAHMAAECEGTGRVVLPGRLLLDVVRTLPAERVSLELRESQRDVEIMAGPSRFHLRTLGGDDFPQLPQPGADEIRLAAAPLIETVERVARAASRDDARPILTGVLVSAEGKRLTMVATDSYRLSVKHTELDEELAQPLEANIPARALRELTRLAGDGVEEIGVSLLANQAVLRAGEFTLSSRLIDGQFPNYRQLLPESFEHEVRLPKADLLDVVTRISQMAQRNAPLRLSFAEGELTVAAETPDVGDASEAMPAPFQGEALEIGFNPEFLRDGIDSIETDEVVLKLISPLRPGLVEPVDRDDYSYLVMPIRLNV